MSVNDGTVLPYPEIWGEVAAERERAHRKHRDTSMEQQPVDDLLRLAILAEEFGEVARVFNEARHRSKALRHSDLLDLRAELIQVAAMAGAWAAAITNLTGPALLSCLGCGVTRREVADNGGWCVTCEPPLDVQATAQPSVTAAPAPSFFASDDVGRSAVAPHDHNGLGAAGA